MSRQEVLRKLAENKAAQNALDKRVASQTTAGKPIACLKTPEWRDMFSEDNQLQKEAQALQRRLKELGPWTLSCALHDWWQACIDSTLQEKRGDGAQPDVEKGLKRPLLAS